MKNNKKSLFVILVLVIGAALIGCASTATKGYANTLEEAHPDRFEKTIIGMSVEEFKAIWPEANRTGVSADGETYEFVYTRLTARIFYGYTIYTYFYFTDNKLVKHESIQRKAGL